jgi:subtilisin family serine protease
VNNRIIDTGENLTTTNATITNATSLAVGCEMQRVIPISTDANMSASDFNVDIAILDTGVSLNHPDLNVYRDVTFINGTTTGNDDNGHGSHVAGIAAAKDNDIGIVGIAPGARIWAIKVCDASGECKITNQIKGVDYAIQHADEIDVLNISIENPNSPALNSIIDAAVKAGITVVVSAGNYGKDASLTSPANNPNVLTVSAIADSDGVCGAAGPDLVLSGDNSNYN